MSGNGDCFLVAARIAVDEGHTLCHGIPTGRATISGRRFAHAWAETADGIAIDRSNGLNAALPAALYYRMGNIDPAEIVRYTPDEARERMLETGTYGPWHEIPEGVL